MLFKKKKEKNLNTDSSILMAHRDIWAIEKCVRGREPWEDTCLKCGKCGRFSK